MRKLLITTGAAILALAVAGPALAQNYNDANAKAVSGGFYQVAYFPGVNGDWDEHHVWRSQAWWIKHHPNEWRQRYPKWDQGAYDAQHVWRDKAWWIKNHPNEWRASHR